jgi:hypothetical protein
MRAIGVAKANNFSLFFDKPAKGKTPCNSATTKASISA